MSRHQPSEHFLGGFLRRLKGNGEPSRAEVPEKQRSWIRRLQGSDYWLWGEFIGFFGVVAALVAFYIDMGDRQTHRIAQAWELVTRFAPGNSGKGPALEYLNSQGISLTGINLSTKSNQGPSYLVEVDLSKADLREANLSRGVFMRANLSRANLSRANLSKAVLGNADLSGANLIDATLAEANLMQANLSGALFRGANLWRADLRGADLSGTDLRSGIFKEAVLMQADLSGADLSEVDLSGKVLVQTNLSRADLSEADLSGSLLKQADLSRAELRETNLSRADLREALGLDQSDLDVACGDENTRLPKGLTIQICPEK